MLAFTASAKITPQKEKKKKQQLKEEPVMVSLQSEFLEHMSG